MLQNNKFKRELVFSVVSVSVYFALLNLANKLSSAINTPNSINALVGIVFFVAVIVYLKKKNLLSYYGIKSLKELDYKNLLFCAEITVMVAEYMVGRLFKIIPHFHNFCLICIYRVVERILDIYRAIFRCTAAGLFIRIAKVAKLHDKVYILFSARL